MEITIYIGGIAKLNFDGCQDELKFCFSLAQVNYDPVRFREHFLALKYIYKVSITFLILF